MKRILLGLFALPVFLVAGTLAYGVLTFKDDRVAVGEAYGFVVGESAQETYERAVALQSEGKFSEFRLGQGSSAFLLDRSSHDPTTYPKWRLVVDPDWWNNAINLAFADGTLVEIWRFRLCCEMP